MKHPFIHVSLRDAPVNFINSNILDFYNFLENFKLYSNKNKRTKLIHISTDEVYGDIIKGRSNENHKYKPSSPYAASKAASDLILYSSEISLFETTSKYQSFAYFIPILNLFPGPLKRCTELAHGCEKSSKLS